MEGRKFDHDYVQRYILFAIFHLTKLFRPKEVWFFCNVFCYVLYLKMLIIEPCGLYYFKVHDIETKWIWWYIYENKIHFHEFWVQGWYQSMSWSGLHPSTNQAFSICCWFHPMSLKAVICVYVIYFWLNYTPDFPKPYILLHRFMIVMLFSTIEYYIRHEKVSTDHGQIALFCEICGLLSIALFPKGVNLLHLLVKRWMVLKYMT